MFLARYKSKYHSICCLQYLLMKEPRSSNVLTFSLSIKPRHMWDIWAICLLSMCYQQYFWIHQKLRHCHIIWCSSWLPPFQVLAQREAPKGRIWSSVVDQQQACQMLPTINNYFDQNLERLAILNICPFCLMQKLITSCSHYLTYVIYNDIIVYKSYINNILVYKSYINNI